MNSLLRLAAGALLATTPLALHASAGSASIAVLGDTPYGSAQEVQFDRVIDAINESRSVRLVVHVGDVKAGSERCDDELFVRRFNQFQKLEDPFVLTPGDNDWTDCHRANNGSYNPVERLGKFREIFYPDPSRSTGQRQIKLFAQSTQPGFESYVENSLWRFRGVIMATLHVVGSNNNLAPWSGIDPADSFANPRPDRLAEYEARKTAALQWIEQIFAIANEQDSPGVLIAMQANPNFEIDAADENRQGFNAVLDKLVEKAIQFRKPVLLVHGDSHYFRLDQPLLGPVNPSGQAILENVQRLESFGSPYVHWIEVKVNPSESGVFRVVPHIIEDNRFPR